MPFCKLHLKIQRFNRVERKKTKTMFFQKKRYFCELKDAKMRFIFIV